MDSSPTGFTGDVIEFIPGRNESPAPVIELDQEIVLPDSAGAVTGQEVRAR